MPKRKRPETPEPPLPSFEPHVPGTEYDTPHRAGAQALWAWEEYNGRKPDSEAILRFLSINRSQGYEIIKSDSARTHGSRVEVNPRGRPPKVSLEKKKEIAYLLDVEDDAQHLTWTQLGMEVGIEAAEITVRTAMKEEGFVDGIQKRREGISQQTAEKRVEQAEGQLEAHPTYHDWKNVIFLDEVHFGWSDEGQLHIKRRIGARDEPQHIQHPREPYDKDRKRHYCWAYVGWNRKSEMIFYDSGNANGKMTQKAYIEQILEPHVLPLLKENPDLVLFDDGDSRHGPGKSNPVREWKNKHGLKHYFNVASSPDLNIIENCWQPPKQYVQKFPYWDDPTTIELIKEGWATVKQESINEKVKTYPQRFKDVIKAGGQITGW